MSDYLHVGAQIAERLRQEVPTLRSVRLAAGLSEIADAVPSAPAAWVVWDGDEIADTASRGASQIIAQRWIVAVVVRSARDADTGAGVVETAGPLLSEVLGALMGWQPQDCLPLVRTTAPQPGYAAGYGYFPLAFRALVHARR